MLGGASLFRTLGYNYTFKALNLLYAAGLSTIPAAVTNALMNWITRGIKSCRKKKKYRAKFVSQEHTDLYIL